MIYCMPRWTKLTIVNGCFACVCLSVFARLCVAEEELTAAEARICVTGFDHNRPDPFPGLGNFIGWAEAIERMPNGELLLAHSAGYYHASFASPRQIEPELKKQYASEGWPVDYVAPTGGRSMVCRSTDNGKTWSKPELVVDYRLDDRPDALFTCRDGTVLCCVNVQASWYGYLQAPPGYEDDISGLNTQQFVVRSTDNGHTWSDPIWIEPPPGGLTAGRFNWMMEAFCGRRIATARKRFLVPCIDRMIPARPGRSMRSYGGRTKSTSMSRRLPN